MRTAEFLLAKQNKHSSVHNIPHTQKKRPAFMYNTQHACFTCFYKNVRGLRTAHCLYNTSEGSTSQVCRGVEDVLRKGWASPLPAPHPPAGATWSRGNPHTGHESGTRKQQNNWLHYAPFLFQWLTKIIQLISTGFCWMAKSIQMFLLSLNGGLPGIISFLFCDHTFT